MIEQEKSAAYRQSMRQGAWTAYLMGAFPKQGFGQVLKNLGLADKRPKLTETGRKALAKNGLRIAERIRALDRKHAKTV